MYRITRPRKFKLSALIYDEFNQTVAAHFLQSSSFNFKQSASDFAAASKVSLVMNPLNQWGHEAINEVTNFSYL